MEIRGTIIEDTFAEAFRMWACRLIVTAIDEEWVRIAAGEVCGYGTSVIGCNTEAAVEHMLSPDETPDGRPGAALLFFAFNADKLTKAMPNRVGQCLMTCPTTAVYDGMPEVKATEDSARIPIGAKLRFFGDGNQKSKVINSRRYWRVPVMDGEFLCEDNIGAVKAIGGGNFLVCGPDQRTTLAATRRAIEAIAPLKDVITPFPGGIVRSGSKVGSRYKGMFASTNDEYCPTLRSRSQSKLREGVRCVYEIVINGLTKEAIAAATRAGIDAACGPGTIAISAGNYGGNLGKFHFKLHEIMSIPLPSAPGSAGGFRVASTSAEKNRPAEPGAEGRKTGGYVLTWKPGAPLPNDGAFIRPDTLGVLSPASLSELVVAAGRTRVRLRNLFDISGEPGEMLTVRGMPPLDRIGAGMRGGYLVISSDAGDDLGASMSGGVIHACNVGHRAGGPDANSDRGMTGGHILIRGNAGDFAGYRMRRGCIAVRGTTGRSPGYRMLAGTIVAYIGPYDSPGLEMRRGTILCLDPHVPAATPPAFTLEGDFTTDELPMLKLVMSDLFIHGSLPPARDGDRVRLFTGDRFELNKGEIWQWLS